MLPTPRRRSPGGGDPITEQVNTLRQSVHPRRDALGIGLPTRRDPGDQALNMVLDDRNIVVTAASPFDLRLETAESGNGRRDGTRIELFLAGAARLDRAAIERLLAA